MKKQISVMLSVLLTVAFVCSASASTSQRPPSMSRGGGASHFSRGFSSRGSNLAGAIIASTAHYALAASIYGLRVATLPSDRILFHYLDGVYYIADGVIYTETTDGDYQVIEPEIGMIIPELPEVNVNAIKIDDKIYFEFDNVIYKQIPTQEGLKYEVIGHLEL